MPQVLLQLAVLATGSFGFHTLLVITLCVSLLDDDWIAGKRSRQQQQQGGGGRLQAVLSGVTLLALAAAAVALFGVRLQDGALTADIGFSADEFAEFVHFAVPASVLLAAASFLLTAADGITSAALDSPGGCCRRLHAALGTAVTVLAAALPHLPRPEAETVLCHAARVARQRGHLTPQAATLLDVLARRLGVPPETQAAILDVTGMLDRP